MQTPQETVQRKSTFLTLFLTSLGGCVFLCFLSIIQKSLVGMAIQPRGFIIPIPIGTASGFLLGLYLIKVEKFQVFQAEAFGVLKSEKKRLDYIVRAIRDGILVTDKQENIVHFNPACLKLLGVDADRLLGQPLWSTLEILTQAYPSDETVAPVRNVPFFLERLGSEKVLRGVFSTLRDDDNRETGLVLVLQDVSHEKKVERLKSEFITTATHELNTPVSVLVGYADLLASGVMEPDQQLEAVDVISQNAWKINHILDDLLNLERIDTSQQIILYLDRHPVRGILREIETSLENVQKTHELIVDLQEPDTILEVDLKRVKRVFNHLLNNAVKFSDEGSRICLKGCATGDLYQFEIEDRGVGIPAEYQEQVFNTFYKADASDTARAGIGLGLSVARSLVLAHSGNLTLESQPGQGTRVFFSFRKVC